MLIPTNITHSPSVHYLSLPWPIVAAPMMELRNRIGLICYVYCTVSRLSGCGMRFRSLPGNSRSALLCAFNRLLECGRRKIAILASYKPPSLVLAPGKQQEPCATPFLSQAEPMAAWKRANFHREVKQIEIF